MTATTIDTTTAAELAEPKAAKAPKIIGVVSIIAGLIMSVLGMLTYNLVGSQLEAQNIIVAQDAPMFAGEAVSGPFTAYVEAQVIGEHAMNSTDGKTYAEMDREDPARATAMNAAFLQASLYTSVIGFGVAALVTGLGVLFILSGAAFVALAKVRK